LKLLPVEYQWAGLRPGSPQGIPYIGEHSRLKGLYVNAGHFRNGIVTGPASARLLADILLEREPILDPVPYTLATTI
jgi:glycine oxidase